MPGQHGQAFCSIENESNFNYYYYMKDSKNIEVHWKEYKNDLSKVFQWYKVY